MRASLLALILVSSASGQTYSPNYPYLLRLDHYTFEDHSCVLLQKTGAFHLEVEHGDEVKVFEGTIDSGKLVEIQRELNSDPLDDLSQQRIEEPILNGSPFDKLQVTIFRGDRWQDLFFRSGDSQQPFKKSLQPLVRWLDGLHKLPHRELSEDAGKNNCLPRTAIALSKRESGAAPQITPKIPSQNGSISLGVRQATRASAPAQPRTLLHIYSLERNSASASERCVIVGGNGGYRVEDRTQKTGRPVETKILIGKIDPDALAQLREILDSPDLVKIKHHEPPGGAAVPVLADITDISISRPDGDQRIILSSGFNRPGFPAFYGGDADPRKANSLLKFVSEHLENGNGQSLSKEFRNECSEAP